MKYFLTFSVFFFSCLRFGSLVFLNFVFYHFRNSKGVMKSVFISTFNRGFIFLTYDFSLLPFTFWVFRFFIFNLGMYRESHMSAPNRRLSKTKCTPFASGMVSKYVAFYLHQSYFSSFFFFLISSFDSIRIYI